MFAVQPRSSNSSDEELGAVGVFAGVGHAEPVGAVMLQLEVLIGETVSIDAFAYIEKDKRGDLISFKTTATDRYSVLIYLIVQLTSGSISSGKVSTLDHEVWNDPVEFASLVTKPFLLKMNKRV